MKKEKRQIVTQSQAARKWNGGQGCKRQRINELIKLGRFTTPVDDKGIVQKGCVYLDEVVNFKEKPKGRPRLTKEERDARGLTGFDIGDKVIWDHKPRDGYGFFVHIPGTVIKLGTKRLKLKLEVPRGSVEVWAYREACRLASDKPASPKKVGQIPDSGILQLLVNLDDPGAKIVKPTGSTTETRQNWHI